MLSPNSPADKLKGGKPKLKKITDEFCYDGLEED
jgi:hypothetical protein